MSESLELDNHTAGGWDSWAVTEQGIHFANATRPAHPLIEFFSFATSKVTLVAAIGRGIGGGVTRRHLGSS